MIQCSLALFLVNMCTVLGCFLRFFFLPTEWFNSSSLFSFALHFHRESMESWQMKWDWERRFRVSLCWHTWQRWERGRGAKRFHSPHSSKTLCGIFSWLHHCFRLTIKHLKGSLFAPASFKWSPVSGFLQVLEHFNELVIWLHSSEELICQLFTFFSLTTPKAKKKKKKRWKCELFSQLSLAGRCMLWASQALQDFLFSGCCSHKHSRPPVAVVDIVFAFLFLQQRDNIWGPFLIISPASTLNNWHQEFTRFVPKFKVRTHRG